MEVALQVRAYYFSKVFPYRQNLLHKSTNTLQKNMSDINDVSRIAIDPLLQKQIDDYQQLPLPQLMQCKDSIEAEIEKFLTVLANDLNSDMTSPLLTGDGFPRNDIDVYQVRYVRQKVNMLRNDLVKVMDQLHTALSSHFVSRSIDSKLNAMTMDGNDGRTPDHGNGNIDAAARAVPFARVTEVTPESPVSVAGINVGDLLCTIGTIDATNHNSLKAIPGLIASCENSDVKITLKRGEAQQLHNVTLRPSRNWPGQGLLGCRLQEI